MKEEIARILLSTGAVVLRPDKPITYVSGTKGPIYCDNRLLMSHPEERKIVVQAFLEIAKTLEFDIIAGTATSGIPWAAWMAEALDKPMIYVRSKTKGHGKQNLIEGKLEPGQHVLVIEDIFNTGGSSIKAVEGVREAGGVVTDCVAISTYNHQKCITGFAEIKCNAPTLTDFQALIRVATSMEKISDKEKQALLDWHKDPVGWGKDK